MRWKSSSALSSSETCLRVFLRRPLFKSYGERFFRLSLFGLVVNWGSIITIDFKGSVYTPNGCKAFMSKAKMPGTQRS